MSGVTHRNTLELLMKQLQIRVSLTARFFGIGETERGLPTANTVDKLRSIFVRLLTAVFLATDIHFIGGKPVSLSNCASHSTCVTIFVLGAE